MAGRKQKSQKRDKEARIVIIGLVFLFAILMVSGMRLYGKQSDYKAKAAELERQIETEEARSEEIDAYEEYVGTDAYIEQIARERLGLAYPNEILLRPEE